MKKPDTNVTRCYAMIWQSELVLQDYRTEGSRKGSVREADRLKYRRVILLL